MLFHIPRDNASYDHLVNQGKGSNVGTRSGVDDLIGMGRGGVNPKNHLIRQRPSFLKKSKSKCNLFNISSQLRCPCPLPSLLGCSGNGSLRTPARRYRMNVMVLCRPPSLHSQPHPQVNLNCTSRCSNPRDTGATARGVLASGSSIKAMPMIV